MKLSALILTVAVSLLKSHLLHPVTLWYLNIAMENQKTWPRYIIYKWGIYTIAYVQLPVCIKKKKKLLLQLDLPCYSHETPTFKKRFGSPLVLVTFCRPLEGSNFTNQNQPIFHIRGIPPCMKSYGYVYIYTVYNIVAGLHTPIFYLHGQLYKPSHGPQ